MSTRLKEVLSTHHYYYWLALYRRQFPGDPFDDASLVTLRLYRNILEAAIFKFGGLDVADDLLFGDSAQPEMIMGGHFASAMAELGISVAEVDTRDQILIGRFGPDAFVQLHSVECLAHEYWYLTACYRRAQKGGVLVVEDAERYHVENDPETERLIQSYDRRNEAYGGGVTLPGLPFHVGELRDPSSVCLMLQYNLGRIRLPADFYTLLSAADIRGADLVPNFIPLPLDLSAYYARHEYTGDDFERAWGLRFDVFLDCVHALTAWAWMNAAWKGAPIVYQYLQRACMIVSSCTFLVDRLCGYFSSIKPRFASIAPTRDQIEQFVSSLTLTDAFREQIDLTTMGPRPLFAEIDGSHILLDLAALLPLLFTAPHRVRMAAQQMKGTVFENYVESVAHELNLSVWDASKPLRAKDGTSREIDVAFLAGDVLVVCEVRCVGTSFAFDRGDREALEFRKQKMETALKDADDKARWLASHRSGANYELPPGASRIASIVVSPFVEYVWSDDPGLWVTEALPRLCTPRELGEFGRTDVQARLRAAPFSMRVRSE